ncbi:MAG: phosphoesterase, partial [Clostridia bacterium]|nr:phosphoesterase [Clostridia bacterium]
RQRLGYEVYASTLNYKNLNKVNCLTLGQSRYLLVEFPFSEFPEHGCEMLYELYLRGIVPIISHPERCHLFRDNFQLIDSLLESGCLLQVDAASIIGVYGWGTKNFAKKLIKENKVHFVASNAHFSEDYREWFLQARKKIIHIAGVEQANLLFNGNADRILKVEVVPTMDINNG